MVIRDSGQWKVGVILALGFSVQAALAGAPALVDSQAADILALCESGSIEADLSAQGAYQLDMKLRNTTDEDLTVRLPPGLVADAMANNTVLAQIQGVGNTGAQGLGLLDANEFQVPAGEVYFARVRAACLNYGIPEPKPSTPL